jgi:hypothetical protein
MTGSDQNDTNVLQHWGSLASGWKGGRILQKRPAQGYEPLRQSFYIHPKTGADQRTAIVHEATGRRVKRVFALEIGAKTP